MMLTVIHEKKNLKINYHFKSLSAISMLFSAKSKFLFYSTNGQENMYIRYIQKVYVLIETSTLHTPMEQMILHNVRRHLFP